MKKCAVLFILLIVAICVFKLQTENSSEDINNKQTKELATNATTVDLSKK